MKIKHIEDFLLQMENSELTENEVRIFWDVLKDWVIDNLEERKDYIQAMKGEFYSICRDNYPEYYFRELVKYDYSYFTFEERCPKKDDSQYISNLQTYINEKNKMCN